MNRLFLSLAMSIVALVGSGCAPEVEGGASPSHNVPAETTSWRGTLAGATGESGVVNIALTSTAGNAKADAKGHIRFVGGSEASLSGSLEVASGTLTLEAGSYSLNGKLEENVITGSFNQGKSTGVFSVLRADEADPVVYCGTYDGPFKGTWNIVVADDGTVTGSHAGDASGIVTGVRTGDEVSLQHAAGTAAGTISGTGVVGTYEIGNSPGGTWEGSVEGCQ